MTEADIAKARTEWADSFNEVARLRKLLPDQIAGERAKHLAAFESALTIPDSMSTDAAMLLVQQNRATELKEATGHRAHYESTWSNVAALRGLKPDSAEYATGKASYLAAFDSAAARDAGRS